MYIVAKRDHVNDNMEIEAFEMNDNDSELSTECAALIDQSVLKALSCMESRSE